MTDMTGVEWHPIKWRCRKIGENTFGDGYIESDCYPTKNPVLVTTSRHEVKVDYVKKHEYGLYFLRTREFDAIAWADLPEPYRGE